MIQSSPLRHEYQDKGDAEPRKQMAHAGLEAKTLGFSQARNQSIRNLTPKLEPFTPDEPYPQPPASPLSPGSVIYHDNEGMNGQDLMNTTKSQTTDSNSSHDGVKSMIQEWEKVNGRFARIASINAPGTHQEFSYDEG